MRIALSFMLSALLACLWQGRSDGFVIVGRSHSAGTMHLQQQQQICNKSPCPHPLERSMKTAKTCLQATTSKASSVEDGNDDEPNWDFNPVFGGLWVALLIFSFFLTPYSPDFDKNMLWTFISSPTNPQGVNEIFVVIFNSLGIMPIIIACLAVPQGSKRGLPITPFAVISIFLGYFTTAPFLTFRAKPVEKKTLSEMAWFSRNVLENKVVNYGVIAALFSLPFSMGIVDNIDNFRELLDGYKSLLSTSQFGCVSSVDFVVLNVAGAAMIPLDYKLRVSDTSDASVDDIDKKATMIALSTLLLPAVGLATYCAWRPKLPED